MNIRRKFSILLLCAMLCGSLAAYGDVPESINFQSVVRTISGSPISNKSVKVRVSILEQTATGAVVYQELHETATNVFGVLNLQIGKGIVVSGAFSDINWGDGAFYVKCETSVDGTFADAIVLTTQMQSVPYALYSLKSASVNYRDIDDRPDLSDYMTKDAVEKIVAKENVGMRDSVRLSAMVSDSLKAVTKSAEEKLEAHKLRISTLESTLEGQTFGYDDSAISERIDSTGKASKVGDEALEEKLGQVKSEFAGRVSATEEDIAAINDGLGALEDGLETANGEIANVKNDVAGVKSDVAEVKDEVETTKGDIETMNGDLISLKNNEAGYLTNATLAESENFKEVKSKLKSEGARIDGLESALAATDERSYNDSVSLVKANKAIEGLKIGQSSLDTRINEDSTRLEEKIKDVTAQIEELYGLDEENTERIVKLMGETSTLRDSVKGLVGNSKAMGNDISGLKGRDKELSDSVKALYDVDAKLAAKIKEDSTKFDAGLKMNAVLKDSVMALSGRSLRDLAKIDGLRSDVDGFAQAKSEMESAIETMQGDIDNNGEALTKINEQELPKKADKTDFDALKGYVYSGKENPNKSTLELTVGDMIATALDRYLDNEALNAKFDDYVKNDDYEKGVKKLSAVDDANRYSIDSLSGELAALQEVASAEVFSKINASIAALNKSKDSLGTIVRILRDSIKKMNTTLEAINTKMGVVEDQSNKARESVATLLDSVRMIMTCLEYQPLSKEFAFKIDVKNNDNKLLAYITLLLNTMYLNENMSKVYQDYINPAVEKIWNDSNVKLEKTRFDELESATAKDDNNKTILERIKKLEDELEVLKASAGN